MMGDRRWVCGWVGGLVWVGRLVDYMGYGALSIIPRDHLRVNNLVVAYMYFVYICILYIPIMYFVHIIFIYRLSAVRCTIMQV